VRTYLQEARYTLFGVIGKKGLPRGTAILGSAEDLIHFISIEPHQCKTIHRLYIKNDHPHKRIGWS